MEHPIDFEVSELTLEEKLMCSIDREDINKVKELLAKGKTFKSFLGQYSKSVTKCTVSLPFFSCIKL